MVMMSLHMYDEVGNVIAIICAHLVCFYNSFILHCTCTCNYLMDS